MHPQECTMVKRYLSQITPSLTIEYYVSCRASFAASVVSLPLFKHVVFGCSRYYPLLVCRCCCHDPLLQHRGVVHRALSHKESWSDYHRFGLHGGVSATLGVRAENRKGWLRRERELSTSPCFVCLLQMPCLTSYFKGRGRMARHFVKMNSQVWRAGTFLIFRGFLEPCSLHNQWRFSHNQNKFFSCLWFWMMTNWSASFVHSLLTEQKYTYQVLKPIISSLEQVVSPQETVVSWEHPRYSHKSETKMMLNCLLLKSKETCLCRSFLLLLLWWSVYYCVWHWLLIVHDLASLFLFFLFFLVFSWLHRNWICFFIKQRNCDL